MPLYTVNVIETRNYNVTYSVEADDPEEALELALIGDTIDEEDLQLTGVTDRHAEQHDVSLAENN